MQRGTDLGRINAEVDPDAQTFTSIRNGAYRLLLTLGTSFATALKTVPLPVWLHARARELWRPLLALAHLADQEPDGFGIMSDLVALAREHVEDRDAEALLAVLVERLGAAPTVTVRPANSAYPS